MVVIEQTNNYLVDAVNELANNKSSPIAFNEIWSNFECNGAEDITEEDYVKINISKVMRKIYDVLLARIT